MSSKPRSIEAKRLESNYLSRLQEALSYLSKSEAAEIEENVREHIRAAVEELDTDEVGLTQMATILEELGSPESLIVEPDVIENPVPDWLDPSETDEVPASESSPLPSADQAKDPDFLEMLDRIFVGYVIFAIGLFIPVIDLSFCAIIGYGVILWNLRRTSLPGFAQGTTWATIALVATAAMCPAALLSLMAPPMALLSGLIALVAMVADIVLFWILFSAIADGIEERGLSELAEKARAHRIYYIIASFLLIVVAIPIGIAVAKESDAVAKTLLAFAILPLTWIINWFVILNPLRAIRRRLREAA